MIAEILLAGTELMTCAPDLRPLARRLDALGVSLARVTAAEDPAPMVDEALARCGLVIVVSEGAARPIEAREGKVVAWLPVQGMTDAFDASLRPWLEKLPDRAARGDEEASLEATDVALLRQRGERVSFAESLTGGLVAARLVSVPGASNVLDESHVTYADQAKHRVLGVKLETLERFTAVSAQCAREMAEGVRAVSRADWGVATTGYAGPDGGADGTPVGTVYVAVAGQAGTWVDECHFQGDRDRVRAQAASHALNALRLRLIEANG